MSTVLGLVAVIIASVFFGSNFIVTKRYPTGDGMFFQLMMCTGVFLVGILVNLYRGCPPVYPLAALGGVLWALGNVWVVPIVKSIGLGMGLLIWGSVNMMAGWSSGHFGHLIGLKSQTVEHPTLNYVGVGVALVALVVYSYINPSEDEARSKTTPAQRSRLLSDPSSEERGGYSATGDYGSELEDRSAEASDEMFVDRMSPASKKTFGVAMSVVSGIFYGVNFDPPTYVMNNYAGASQEGIDYVFSHFLGIWITSLTLFVLYALYNNNKPVVFAESMLPAMLSGAIWAVAQTSWFIANQNLEFVVSFPLVTSGPGIIGALWGVFVFGEIKGTRNYLILTSAIALSMVADVLIVLSHPE